jgi:hypothetical protein
MRNLTPGITLAIRVTHFLDWFLIGWTLVSALATPFVARFVASRFDDPQDDDILAASPAPRMAITNSKPE